jgi:phospholipid/cholesterol/gamma-HCH transport system substrate-binding protein
MSQQARLGLIVIAGIVAFLLALFILANRTFLLANTFRVHAEFNDVGGLMSGAVVQYQGVNVGRVDFVQLPHAPGAPIRVGMAIRESARHLVRVDSRAAIQTEGLVGNMMIVLTGGSQTQPVIAEGGTITGIDPFSFAAVTDRLFESVSRFDDVTILLTDMMGEIRTGQGTLSRFLYDARLYDEAVLTTQETRAALGSLTARADALVGIAADAGTGVNAILQRVHTGEGTLARILNEPEIYDALLAASQTFSGAAGNIEAITDRAENAANWATLGMFRFAENMEALKDNWFFRGYYERRGFREQAPFEIREQALSETFRALEQRERELYEWEQRLQQRDRSVTTIGADASTPASRGDRRPSEAAPVGLPVTAAAPAEAAPAETAPAEAAPAVVPTADAAPVLPTPPAP